MAFTPFYTPFYTYPIWYDSSTMTSTNSNLSKRDIISEIIEDAYSKIYKVRMVGPGSLEATIPRAMVEREARKCKLSIQEFIEVYQVEYRFNDFDGAFLRFKKQPRKDEGEPEAQEKIGRK